MMSDLVTYRPARCKTGLAASRRTMRVHRVAGLESTLVETKIAYRARWLCGSSSQDAVVVADPGVHGGICDWCEDVAAGPAVYRYFNAAGRLLYVGSSETVLARRKEHAKRSRWWSNVANERVERFPTIAAARSSEVVAIRTERPLHNKLFNGGDA